MKLKQARDNIDKETMLNIIGSRMINNYMETDSEMNNEKVIPIIYLQSFCEVQNSCVWLSVCLAV